MSKFHDLIEPFRCTYAIQFIVCHFLSKMARPKEECVMKSFYAVKATVASRIENEKSYKIFSL